MDNFIIGIDEAGRGPLAGPVSVGVFMAPKNLNKKLIKILGGKIKDSKKLSPDQRYTIYRTLSDLKKNQTINFFVSHISNKIIDRIGISKAIQKGINAGLKYLTPPSLSLRPSHRSRRGGKENIIIRLDGLLKAPQEFKDQKTIIKGDEKDIFIACASIVAKVERDQLMTKLAKKYPDYGFEVHKGYGTAKHTNLIRNLGLSSLHRATFCKNLTNINK